MVLRTLTHHQSQIRFVQRVANDGCQHVSSRIDTVLALRGEKLLIASINQDICMIGLWAMLTLTMYHCLQVLHNWTALRACISSGRSQAGIFSRRSGKVVVNLFLAQIDLALKECRDPEMCHLLAIFPPVLASIEQSIPSLREL